MWSRFVLVIVRLLIVLAHWMIGESVPHKNSPQVRMAFKTHSKKIEDLALLQFSAPEHRRQRRQNCIFSPVYRSRPDKKRTLLLSDRIEVVDSFKVTGKFLSFWFLNYLFLTVDDLRVFLFATDYSVKPIHSGYIGTVVEL